jgi:hypothetical protein
VRPMAKLALAGVAVAVAVGVWLGYRATQPASPPHGSLARVHPIDCLKQPPPDPHYLLCVRTRADRLLTANVSGNQRLLRLPPVGAARFWRPGR